MIQVARGSKASFWLYALFVFYTSLGACVHAADEKVLAGKGRKGYAKGDLMPVSCLDRTVETGEHIQDSAGNLQYIPFPSCLETSAPLSFPYLTPLTQTCTLAALPDDLYHLLEFFVHNDVPLTCRIPSYPVNPASSPTSSIHINDHSASLDKPSTPATDTGSGLWTPFTIALQGTLQLSHLHLHTGINVLFHTTPSSASDKPSHLIAATAYSLPNLTSPTAPQEGTKVLRSEPVTFTFNVGWIDGAVLPGMAGRPVIGVKDHGVGFGLLSFFALAASAGVGAMGMLVHERRKRGSSMNGLLGGNVGIGGGGIRLNGYGGYGGYGVGKRD